jgi:hypothetical protein
MHSSPNIFKMTKPQMKRWAEHVICMKRHTYTVLIWKPNGKRWIIWYIQEKNIKTGGHVLDSSGPW